MRAIPVRPAFLFACVLASGCATDAPKRELVEVASPATVEQLRADQRETERVRRYITRKHLCRQMNVRFDGSGRCW